MKWAIISGKYSAKIVVSDLWLKQKSFFFFFFTIFQLFLSMILSVNVSHAQVAHHFCILLHRIFQPASLRGWSLLPPRHSGNCNSSLQEIMAGYTPWPGHLAEWYRLWIFNLGVCWWQGHGQTVAGIFSRPGGQCSCQHEGPVHEPRPVLPDSR